MNKNIINSFTKNETSANMADTEVNGITAITRENGFEKDESDIPLLQKPCFLSSSILKEFRNKTLSKISSEYQHCDQEDDDYMDHISTSVDEPDSSSKTMPIRKQLRVKCLHSYEELIRLCENSGLKFINSAENERLHRLAQQYKLKRCTVNCLETYEELEKTCEKLNLKYSVNNSIITYKELYEVDLILEHKIEENVKYYLVKWKNYELQTSTWEPYYHLMIGEGCKKLVHYYDYINSSTYHLKKEMVVHFIQELVSRRPYDILTLSRLCSLVYGFSESDPMNLTSHKLRNQAKSIINVPISVLVKFKHQLLQLMSFSEVRKQVLIELQEWKDRINAHNPTTYIEVENNVDLERAPSDFKFIHDYVSEGIFISDEPVAFCSCNNCYESKNSCCPHDSDGHFSYNRYGRLQLLPGYPIYECNKLCKCGPDCVNRVVQHGQKIKVAIFRTSNGCGWGLKALEVIHKDQFVLEYLGEILTSEDAEMRGNIYDRVGRSYLFDLDYGERNCQFTVDAGCLGNAAHFINHSCDPNLHVFAVWINNQDPRLPRLAFFAKKKIERGEELTFDYKMVKNSERFDSQSPIPEKDRMLCKCNTKRCRKYLF